MAWRWPRDVARWRVAQQQVPEVDTGPAAVVADHYEGDDLHRSREIERWPMFAAAVVERSSVRAVFALPLQWGAVNLGVLDLYRREPGAAISAADTAALMMLGLRTDPDHGGDGWLDHAVAHRAEIHQATGMVSVQLDVSASQALARMRAHAFVHNRLLTDVARDVVARRLVFTEDVE
jgi:ANTAR domain